MVKAKSNKYKGVNFKLYFFILSSLFSVLALIIFVVVSQKPTNTQSDASGSNCIMTPKLSLGKTEGGEKYVTYYLRVDNKSDVSCRKNVRYVFAKQSINAIWLLEYFNEFGNMITYNGQPANATPFGLLYPSSRVRLSVKIFPPSGLKRGDYIIPVKVCRSSAGPSDPGYESYLNNITADCSKVNLKYVKE